MWKPSQSEIEKVVASEIELDRGNVEDLEARLVARADLARQRTPCDPWSDSLRDPDVWSDYQSEVELQVREMLHVEQQLKDDPPEPPMTTAPVGSAPELANRLRVVRDRLGFHESDNPDLVRILMDLCDAVSDHLKLTQRGWLT